MKNVAEKLNEVLGIAEELIQEEREENKVVEMIPVSTTPSISPSPITNNSINTSIDIFQEIEESTKERISELNEDIKAARDNLSFLIKIGKDAADELQNLAIESEEPRMYEVFSELINSISSVTKEMISLHKVRSDIIRNEFERKRPVKEEIKNLTQNNTTVYLNTTDVIKAIREGAMDADIQSTAD
jgi:hypothetical protein